MKSVSFALKVVAFFLLVTYSTETVIAQSGVSAQTVSKIFSENFHARNLSTVNSLGPEGLKELIHSRSELRSLPQNVQESGINLPVEREMQAIAGTLQAAFLGMKYGDNIKRDLISKDHPIEIVELDANDLVFPHSPNVAFVGGATLQGSAAMAYWASRGKATNANFLFIPFFNGLSSGKNHPSMIFTEYAAFFDREGKLIFGHFKKPIAIHAFIYPGPYDEPILKTLYDRDIPLMDGPSARLLSRDKGEFSSLLKDLNVVGAPKTLVVQKEDRTLLAEKLSRFVAGDADAKKLLSHIVIKPSDGHAGIGVKMFTASELDSAVEYASHLLENSPKIVIQERIMNDFWKDSLHTYDWNLRIISTWDEDGVVVDENAIEVRYKPVGYGPVNKSRGAKVMTLHDFFEARNFNPLKRAQFLEDIKRAIESFTQELETKFESRPLPAKRFYRNFGLVGWDLQQAQDERWYVIEANLGNIGGLGTIESLMSRDDKGRSVLPVLQYFAMIANQYDANKQNIRTDESGEVIRFLGSEFIVLNYTNGMNELGEYDASLSLLDQQKAIQSSPQLEHSVHRALDLRERDHELLELGQHLPEEVSASSLMQFIRDQLENNTKEFQTASEEAVKIECVKRMIVFYRYKALNIRKLVKTHLEKLYNENAHVVRTALMQSFEIFDADIIEAAIITLGFLDRSANNAVKDQSVAAISALLDRDESLNLKKAALKAIRFLGNLRAKQTLLAHLNKTNFFQPLIQELCSMLDDSLLDSIIQAIKLRSNQSLDTNLHNIPPYLAMILSPAWISERLDDRDVVTLAMRFGFIDRAVYDLLVLDNQGQWIDAVRTLLNQIGIATENLLRLYKDTAPERREMVVSSWRKRMTAFQQNMLSENVVTKKLLVPILLDRSAEAQIDQDLLFAALREMDKMGNVERYAEPHIFERERKDELPGTFFRMTVEHFKQKVYNEVIKNASDFLKRTSASEELQSLLLPFLVTDAMYAATETREEESEEAKYAHFSKWKAIAKMLEIKDGKLAFKPEFEFAIDEDFTEIIENGVSLDDQRAVQELISDLAFRKNQSLWRFGVLNPVHVEKTENFLSRAMHESKWRTLSAGAQSALRLYAYTLHLRGLQPSDISLFWNRELDKIADEENSRPPHLPSVGMELQNSNVIQEDAYVWKQALESFGIPSPHRLEFFDMVEASFLPTWSSHAYVIAIQSLKEIGFFQNYKKGISMHLSVAGDLGNEAHLLALPLRTMEEDIPIDSFRTYADWYEHLKRKMSKGFIHRNKASVSVSRGTEPPPVHTEFRLTYLNLTSRDGDVLDPTYREFIPAFQQLSHAAFQFQRKQAGELLEGDDSKLAGVWTEYRAQIELLYRQRQYHAASLLDADWFQQTGDAYAPELVGKLGIIQKMIQMNKALKDREELKEELYQKTREIFLDSAARAQALLPRATEKRAELRSDGLKERNAEESRTRAEREFDRFRTKTLAHMRAIQGEPHLGFVRQIKKNFEIYRSQLTPEEISEIIAWLKKNDPEFTAESATPSTVIASSEGAEQSGEQIVGLEIATPAERHDGLATTEENTDDTTPVPPTEATASPAVQLVPGRTGTDDADGDQNQGLYVKLWGEAIKKALLSFIGPKNRGALPKRIQMSRARFLSGKDEIYAVSAAVIFRFPEPPPDIKLLQDYIEAEINKLVRARKITHESDIQAFRELLRERVFDGSFLALEFERNGSQASRIVPLGFVQFPAIKSFDPASGEAFDDSKDGLPIIRESIGYRDYQFRPEDGSEIEPDRLEEHNRAANLQRILSLGQFAKVKGVLSNDSKVKPDEEGHGKPQVQTWEDKVKGVIRQIRESKDFGEQADLIRTHYSDLLEWIYPLFAELHSQFKQREDDPWGGLDRYPIEEAITAAVQEIVGRSRLHRFSWHNDIQNLAKESPWQRWFRPELSVLKQKLLGEKLWLGIEKWLNRNASGGWGSLKVSQAFLLKFLTSLPDHLALQEEPMDRFADSADRELVGSRFHSSIDRLPESAVVRDALAQLVLSRDLLKRKEVLKHLKRLRFNQEGQVWRSIPWWKRTWRFILGVALIVSTPILVILAGFFGIPPNESAEELLYDGLDLFTGYKKRESTLENIAKLLIGKDTLPPEIEAVVRQVESQHLKRIDPSPAAQGDRIVRSELRLELKGGKIGSFLNVGGDAFSYTLRSDKQSEQQSKQKNHLQLLTPWLPLTFFGVQTTNPRQIVSRAVGEGHIEYAFENPRKNRTPTWRQTELLNNPRKFFLRYLFDLAQAFLSLIFSGYSLSSILNKVNIIMFLNKNQDDRRLRSELPRNSVLKQGSFWTVGLLIPPTSFSEKSELRSLSLQENMQRLQKTLSLRGRAKLGRSNLGSEIATLPSVARNDKYFGSELRLPGRSSTAPHLPPTAAKSELRSEKTDGKVTKQLPSNEDQRLLARLGFELVQPDGEFPRRIRYSEEFKPVQLQPHVILVPHALTPANEENRFNGQTQNEHNANLSEAGERQAEEGARELWSLLEEKIKSGTKVHFYASPSNRVLKTVEYFKRIANENGIDLRVNLDKDLLEIKFGHWEGRTIEEIKRDVSERETQRAQLYRSGDALIRSKGGESFLKFTNRVHSFAKKLNKDFNSDEIVVLFGHRTFFSALKLVTQRAQELKDGYINWRSFIPDETRGHPILLDSGPIQINEWTSALDDSIQPAAFDPDSGNSIKSLGDLAGFLKSVSDWVEANDKTPLHEFREQLRKKISSNQFMNDVRLIILRFLTDESNLDKSLSESLKLIKTDFQDQAIAERLATLIEKPVRQLLQDFKIDFEKRFLRIDSAKAPSVTDPFSWKETARDLITFRWREVLWSRLAYEFLSIDLGRFFFSTGFLLLAASFVGGITLAAVVGFLVHYVAKPFYDGLLFNLQDFSNQNGRMITYEPFPVGISKLVPTASWSEVERIYYETVSFAREGEIFHPALRLYLFEQILSGLSQHQLYFQTVRKIRKKLEEENTDVNREKVWRIITDAVTESHLDFIDQKVLFLYGIFGLHIRAPDLRIDQFKEEVRKRDFWKLFINAPTYLQAFRKKFWIGVAQGILVASAKVINPLLRKFELRTTEYWLFLLQNRLLGFFKLKPIHSRLQRVESRQATQQPFLSDPSFETKKKELVVYLRSLNVPNSAPLLDFIEQNINLVINEFRILGWWDLNRSPYERFQSMKEKTAFSRIREGRLEFDLDNKTIRLSTETPDFLNALVLIKFASLAFRHEVIRGEEKSIHLTDSNLIKLQKQFVIATGKDLLQKTRESNQENGKAHAFRLLNFVKHATQILWNKVYSYPNKPGILTLRGHNIIANSFQKARESFIVSFYMIFAKRFIAVTNQPVFESPDTAKPGKWAHAFGFLKPLWPLISSALSSFYYITLFSTLFGGFILNLDLSFIMDYLIMLKNMLAQIDFLYIGDLVRLVWYVIEGIYFTLQNWFDQFLQLFHLDLTWLRDAARSFWEWLQPARAFLEDYVIPFFYQFVIPGLLYAWGMVFGYVFYKLNARAVFIMVVNFAFNSLITLAAHAIYLLSYPLTVILLEEEKLSELQPKIESALKNNPVTNLVRFLVIFTANTLYFSVGIMSGLLYILVLGILSYPPVDLQMLVHVFQSMGIPVTPIMFVYFAAALIGLPYSFLYSAANFTAKRIELVSKKAAKYSLRFAAFGLAMLTVVLPVALNYEYRKNFIPVSRINSWIRENKEWAIFYFRNSARYVADHRDELAFDITNMTTPESDAESKPQIPIQSEDDIEARKAFRKFLAEKTLNWFSRLWKGQYKGFDTLIDPDTGVFLVDWNDFGTHKEAILTALRNKLPAVYGNSTFLFDLVDRIGSNKNMNSVLTDSEWREILDHLLRIVSGEVRYKTYAESYFLQRKALNALRTFIWGADGISLEKFQERLEFGLNVIPYFAPQLADGYLTYFNQKAASQSMDFRKTVIGAIPLHALRFGAERFKQVRDVIAKLKDLKALDPDVQFWIDEHNELINHMHVKESMATFLEDITKEFRELFKDKSAVRELLLRDWNRADANYLSHLVQMAGGIAQIAHSKQEKEIILTDLKSILNESEAAYPVLQILKDNLDETEFARFLIELLNQNQFSIQHIKKLTAMVDELASSKTDAASRARLELSEKWISEFERLPNNAEHADRKILFGALALKSRLVFEIPSPELEEQVRNISNQLRVLTHQNSREDDWSDVEKILSEAEIYLTQKNRSVSSSNESMINDSSKMRAELRTSKVKSGPAKLKVQSNFNIYFGENHGLEPAVEAAFRLLLDSSHDRIAQGVVKIDELIKEKSNRRIRNQIIKGLIRIAEKDHLLIPNIRHLLSVLAFQNIRIPQISNALRDFLVNNHREIGKGSFEMLFGSWAVDFSEYVYDNSFDEADAMLAWIRKMIRIQAIPPKAYLEMLQGLLDAHALLSTEISLIGIRKKYQKKIARTLRLAIRLPKQESLLYKRAVSPFLRAQKKTRDKVRARYLAMQEILNPSSRSRSEKDIYTANLLAQDKRWPTQILNQWIGHNISSYPSQELKGANQYWAGMLMFRHVLPSSEDFLNELNASIPGGAPDRSGIIQAALYVLEFMERAYSQSLMDAKLFLWKLGEIAASLAIEKKPQENFLEIVPPYLQASDFKLANLPVLDLASGPNVTHWFNQIDTGKHFIFTDESYFMEAFLNRMKKLLKSKGKIEVRRVNILDSTNLFREKFYQHVRFGNVGTYVDGFSDQWFHALIERIPLGGQVTFEYPVYSSDSETDQTNPTLLLIDQFKKLANSRDWTISHGHSRPIPKSYKQDGIWKYVVFTRTAVTVQSNSADSLSDRSELRNTSNAVPFFTLAIGFGNLLFLYLVSNFTSRKILGLIESGLLAEKNYRNQDLEQTFLSGNAQLSELQRNNFLSERAAYLEQLKRFRIRTAQLKRRVNRLRWWSPLDLVFRTFFLREKILKLNKDFIAWQRAFSIVELYHKYFDIWKEEADARLQESKGRLQNLKSKNKLWSAVDEKMREVSAIGAAFDERAKSFRERFRHFMSRYGSNLRKALGGERAEGMYQKLASLNLETAHLSEMMEMFQEDLSNTVQEIGDKETITHQEQTDYQSRIENSLARLRKTFGELEINLNARESILTEFEDVMRRHRSELRLSQTEPTARRSELRNRNGKSDLSQITAEIEKLPKYATLETLNETNALLARVDLGDASAQNELIRGLMWVVLKAVKTFREQYPRLEQSYSVTVTDLFGIGEEKLTLLIRNFPKNTSDDNFRSYKTNPDHLVNSLINSIKNSFRDEIRRRHARKQHERPSDDLVRLDDGKTPEWAEASAGLPGETVFGYSFLADTPGRIAEVTEDVRVLRQKIALLTDQERHAIEHVFGLNGKQALGIRRYKDQFKSSHSTVLKIIIQSFQKMFELNGEEARAAYRYYARTFAREAVASRRRKTGSDAKSELRETKSSTRTFEVARISEFIKFFESEHSDAELLKHAEEFGVDLRPAKAGLLHPLYVAHDMAVKSVVNPHSQPKKALYKGAGADVSNFLLSTNATEADFVSDYGQVTIEELGSLSDIRPDDAEFKRNYRDYSDTKYYYGFGVIGKDQNNRPSLLSSSFGNARALAIELHAMGVDLKSVRIFKDARGYPSIAFDWAYLGDQPKTRMIHFLDVSNYHRALRHNSPYDFYYRRAGLAIAKLDYIEQQIRRIYKWIKPGGFLITDDVAKGSAEEYVNFSDKFPNDLSVQNQAISDYALFESTIRRLREQLAGHSVTDADARYGWDVTIRQKPVRGAERKVHGKSESVGPVSESRSELRRIGNRTTALMKQRENLGSRDGIFSLFGVGENVSASISGSQMIGILPNLGRLPDLVYAVSENLARRSKLRIAIFAGTQLEANEIKSYLPPDLIESGRVVIVSPNHVRGFFRAQKASQLIAFGLPEDSGYANWIRKLLQGQMDVQPKIASLDQIEEALGIRHWMEAARSELRAKWMNAIAA